MNYVLGSQYLFVHRDSAAARLARCGTPDTLTDPRVARVFREAYRDVIANDPRNVVCELIDICDTSVMAIDLEDGQVVHADRDEYAALVPFDDEHAECVLGAADRAFIRRAFVQALWVKLDESGRDAIREMMPSTARDIEEILALNSDLAAV